MNLPKQSEPIDLGATNSQARAWSEVYQLCDSLGMPFGSSGKQSVLDFIDSLAKSKENHVAEVRVLINRLHEICRERDQAVAERCPHDYDLIRAERDQAIAYVERHEKRYAEVAKENTRLGMALVEKHELLANSDLRIKQLLAEVEQLKSAILKFGNGNDFDWNFLTKLDDLEEQRDQYESELRAAEALNEKNLLAYQALEKTSYQYRTNWLTLQEATGEQCLEQAVERVKEWRKFYEEIHIDEPDHWDEDKTQAELAATKAAAEVEADGENQVAINEAVDRENELAARRSKLPPIPDGWRWVEDRNEKYNSEAKVWNESLEEWCWQDYGWYTGKREYIVPIDKPSVATPEAPEAYRKLGYRVREAGEVICEGDYTWQRERMATLGEPYLATIIGTEISNDQCNYYLEPLKAPSPMVEVPIKAMPIEYIEAGEKVMQQKMGVIITREGCYRRRDGKVVEITERGDEWQDKNKSRYVYESDGFVFDKNDIDDADIVAYLAPLPPANTRLLDVQPGDELSEVAGSYCLATCTPEWNPCNCNKAEAGMLYAIPIDLTPEQQQWQSEAVERTLEKVAKWCEVFFSITTTINGTRTEEWGGA